MMYSLIKHIKEGKNEAIYQLDAKGNITKIISYQELFQQIEQTASWLDSLGLKERDRIALAIGNSSELLIISWAAWSCGIVTVPLDTKRDTVEDMQYKVNLCKAKIVVAKEEIKIDARVVEYKPDGKGKAKFKDGIDHDALVLFTSGTTGHPKGALLTLKNLITNAEGIQEWFKIKQDDRFLVLLPLHHINSTTFCLASLLGHASIAIPPAYSASNFWAQAASSGATFSSIVQTICYDQLGQEKQFEAVRDKIKLNRIQIGSAPVIPTDVLNFYKKYNIRLYQGYGQTETALRVTGIPMNVKNYEEIVKTNSIGKKMKWAEIAILDSQANVLGEEKEGEIAVRGPIIMKGYIGGENAFKDGWFMTGDLGYYKIIDGDPFYFIKGRMKEIIIKGGVNLSPVAIEEKIKKIDEDIDQVYVIGMPDERYGEEVAAVIVWKKNSMTRLKYKLGGKTSIIADYEKPRYLTSIKAQDLPMTSTRKVQRTELKKIPLEKFEPSEEIARSKDYRFVRLSSSDKHRFRQALELYNKCWNPVSIKENTFRQHVDNGMIIAAVKGRQVEGLLSVLISSLSENQLLNITYDNLTAKSTMATNDTEGDKLVLVSICSSNYNAEEIADIIIDDEQANKYIESGQDFVLKFHAKPKGGLSEGGRIVGILKNSRPEDKRAYGYNVLVKYPTPQNIEISEKSVAQQLIEAGLKFASEFGIKDVYAFSRPAGITTYFAKIRENKAA